MVLSVALWLVCQVVDVVSDPLGLPDWTLRFIIVIGLIGFPIALILSWLFDVTRDGVVPDQENRAKACARKPFDQVLDCALVIAAMIIGIQLATGLVSTEVVAAEPTVQRVAVIPFHVANGEGAAAYAHGLVGELQHELTLAPGITVVAAREPYLTRDVFSLHGTVTVVASKIRVTANLVDNDSGEIRWSRAFENVIGDEIHATSTIAEAISDALRTTLEVTSGEGLPH